MSTEIESIPPDDGRSNEGTDTVTDKLKEEVELITETQIATARAVLQAIVDTNEVALIEPVDQIAGFSVEDIRSAVRVVAGSIMGENDAFIGDRSLEAEKSTPQGMATLAIGDAMINLYVVKARVHAVEFQFATPEPGGEERKRTRFIDQRRDEGRISHVKQNNTLKEFRHMIKGLRWMSANMLAWGEPDIIMPNQLDNKGLPKPSSGQPPKVIGR